MFRPLLLTLSALLLTGCAAEPTPAAEPTASRPALWALKDADTTIYLFGTVHALPKDMRWRDAVLDRAFASARKLVIEIGGDDDPMAAAATMQRMAAAPPGTPPLLERIAPAKREALAALVARTGIPMAVFDRLETWGAALLLTGPMMSDLGLGGESGVEAVLKTDFETAKRPISGLETVEQQLSFLDTLPEAEQRKMLDGYVEPPEETRAEFGRMLAAWSRGDERAIAATFDEELKVSPALREALLVRRNAHWANALKAMLNEPGTVLVAVGAGHLAGAGSVQEMLAKQGLRVERVH